MKNEHIIIGETYRIIFNRKAENCRHCSKLIGFYCKNCSKKVFDGIGLCISALNNNFAFVISDTEMVILNSDSIISVSQKKFKIRKAFLKNFIKKLDQQ